MCDQGLILAIRKGDMSTSTLIFGSLRLPEIRKTSQRVPNNIKQEQKTNPLFSTMSPINR